VYQYPNRGKNRDRDEQPSQPRHGCIAL